MIHALTALNILAGLFLIGVVLLQSGKGADMGAAFGGGSATVFGPSGAGNFLTKLTAATAAAFMITSLLLAVLSAKQVSLFDRTPEPVAEAPAPIAPTAAAEAGDTAAVADTEAATDTEATGTASAKAADAPTAAPAATDTKAKVVDTAKAATSAAATGAKEQAAQAAATTETPASAPAAP